MQKYRSSRVIKFHGTYRSFYWSSVSNWPQKENGFYRLGSQFSSSTVIGILIRGLSAWFRLSADLRRWWLSLILKLPYATRRTYDKLTCRLYLCCWPFYYKAPLWPHGRFLLHLISFRVPSCFLFATFIPWCPTWNFIESVFLPFLCCVPLDFFKLVAYAFNVHAY